MHKPQEYVAIPRRSGIVGGLQPHHHPEIARRCLTQLSFATKWYYFRETSVEGLTGIEPALSAWEAEVLPLNYSPVSRVP